MDDAIRAALRQGQVIDITTTGRKTGQPRRIEIVFHVFGGRIYISGMPRADRERAWLKNLRTDRRMTFHLKNGPVADLAATARVIDDPVERHEVIPLIARVWRRDPVEMEAHSPLIEVLVDGYEASRAA
jgi:deazaflavin-dependent oxidoreductase (nitroreductase family)